MSAFDIHHTNIAVHPAQAPPPGYMALTVVGSGVSTGVPVIGHIGLGCACEYAVADPSGPNNRNNISLLITLPRRDLPELTSASTAAAAATTVEAEARSSDAGAPQMSSGPSHARFAADSAGNYMGTKPVAHILIDCGKTFRDAYFKVLIRCNIRSIDTLLLTHGHADAVAGLDDLRDLQTMHMIGTGDWVIDSFVPTYLSPSTLDTLQKSADYIVRNSVQSGYATATPAEHAAQLAACLEQREAQAVAKGNADKEGGWRNIGIRRSTALDLFYMDETQPQRMYVPITAAAAADNDDVTDAGSSGSTGSSGTDIPFYSFPVEHGKGYISMAWVFGRGTAFKSRQQQQQQQQQLERGSCVVYISDVSEVPAASMTFLQDLVKIDVLFVDCLSPTGRVSPVHYCEDDLMALVVALKPRRVFGVGMHCTLEHTQWTAELQKALDAHIAAGRLQPGEVELVELSYDGMQLVIPQ
ncbi:Metallo-beta-lactamase superfamily/Beta-lactamase superfamily domain containing protein [Novymonas esmeraldas]|uniref:Metallo-beta-lactamase superfamily/Beta-lactamase superfamily domain containing protein n=1 Tax=Novymonas esmeraldas TaxID=1808958 RepID=A0AAW0EPJ7_9TRYP